jgi:hypothetical protein
LLHSISIAGLLTSIKDEVFFFSSFTLFMLTVFASLLVHKQKCKLLFFIDNFELYFYMIFIVLNEELIGIQFVVLH